MNKPTTDSLHVIYLEDKPRDRELVAETLAGGGIACEIIHSRSRAEFETALARPNVDLILCDFTLPNYSGTEALAAARERQPETPFIFVSGTIGEERAVESLRSGATDYVLKDRLERLVPAVRRALHDAEERLYRKQAEARIERACTEMAAVYDAIPLMICLVSPEGGVERVNRAMAQFAASLPTPTAPLSPGDLLGCVNALADPYGCSLGQACENCPLHLAIIKTSITGESCRQTEADMLLSQTGIRREAHFSITTTLVRLQDQPKVLLCLEDITPRKLLEQELRQAQKLEAIGQLAGGVAHDFNNTLAVIRGQADLLLLDAGQHPAVINDGLTKIVAAAERAANLPRQLLAFCRKQVLQAQPFNLTEVIVNLTRMLERIIGEDIQLQCGYAPDPLFIHGDVGMIEQVLMNLVVNARDAILHGGQVRLATERVTLEADYVRLHPEARAGEFVRLSVSDNGTGIAPEVRPRIFEPFFTTKGIGRGTGLGLSIVYGIIQQHQGWIEVTSQPGAGTRFDLLLPAIPAPFSIASADEPSAKPPGGNEWILVVEDDCAILALTQTLLETYGYRVWTAESADDALEIWHAHASEVSLLLTDIRMPGSLTVLELAEQLY
ncbi:MAG: response regulator, partial [Verrucomicrobia bacterium]|nr:response regulator [Verrucomicrobiota bacterium]